MEVSAAERTRVEQLVGDLASRFADAGHTFYLVGGIVRDLLLDLGLDGDIDVTTDALPPQSKRILEQWADAIWDQGARFGTIGARRGDVMVEVTTHRAERYDPDSRKPDVDFSTEVIDDLSRRDFTINAMAISPVDWAVMDPYSGRADLQAGVLRTPIDPAASFTDDPLRMLRAARFMARFELTPDEDLRRAMADYAGRLDIVSRERISEELKKFFAVSSAAAGLRLLSETGVLRHVVPGSAEVSSVQFDAFDRVGQDAALRWAVLLWPARTDGVAVAGWLNGLRESGAFVRRVRAILSAAVVLESHPVTDIVEARRVFMAAGGELGAAQDLLIAMEVPLDPASAALLERVARAESDTLRSPLDGSEVMALLGIEGPVVGEALAHLLEHRVVRGPLDAQAARDELRRWWDERGDEV